MSVFKSLLDYFKPPKYENELNNFSAYTIYFQIITTFLGALSYLVFMFIDSNAWQFYMSASYLLFFLSVFYYFLLKRGRIKAIGSIYIASNLIITLLFSYFDSGLKPQGLLNLFLIILSSVLIFNWKVGRYIGAISIIIHTILILIDQNQLLPKYIWTNSYLSSAFYFSTFFLGVFVILASSIFAVEKLLTLSKQELEENIRTKTIIAENEKKLSILLESSPNAIFMRDLTGKTTYANPSARKYCGYSLEELISMDFKELLEPSEIPKEADFWLETILKGCAEREFKLINKDGSLYYYLITSKLNDNNNEVFYYSQNITKIKLAEIKTYESLQAFQMIFEESPFVLTLNSLDGKYVDVNKRFCEFNNIKKEFVLGKTPSDLFQAENSSVYKKMLEEFNKRQFVENYEFPHITPSGVFYYALASIKQIEIGNQKYILTAIQNITQIKIIQKQLESSNEYINKIISSIPSIVWHFKFKDNQMVETFISEAADRILSLEPGTINNNFSKFFAYIHHDDVELAVKTITFVQTNQVSNAEIKFKVIDNNNQIKYLHTKGSSKIEEDGSILTFGVTNDETLSAEFENRLIALNKELEYKVAERTEELNSTLEQLQTTNYELSTLNEDISNESQKLLVLNEQLIVSEESLKEALASKNKLFSIIAHDLRNPVSGIIQTTELLKNYFHKMSTEEAMNFINNLYLSSNSVYNLLVNLLEWARSQTNKIRYKADIKNLYDTISEVLNVQKQLADAKNIEVLVNVGNPSYAFYDKYMINVVFRNLLSNAVKFTPIGGKVEINSSINMESYSIEIEIKDNGVGIPESKISKIFIIEPNHSTTGTEGEKGTGLGLALCKEFVEKNGGSIWVESEKGRGSSFKFTIPLEKF